MNSFIPIFSAFFHPARAPRLEISQTHCRIQHHDARATEKSRRQRAQSLHVPCVLRNRHTGFRELPAPAAVHGRSVGYQHQFHSSAHNRSYLSTGRWPTVRSQLTGCLGDNLLYFAALSFPTDAPERDGLGVGKLFHPPG